MPDSDAHDRQNRRGRGHWRSPSYYSDQVVRGAEDYYAGKGEEPENVLVSDVPILATVGLWATTCAAILVWS